MKKLSLSVVLWLSVLVLWTASFASNSKLNKAPKNCGGTSWVVCNFSGERPSFSGNMKLFSGDMKPFSGDMGSGHMRPFSGDMKLFSGDMFSWDMKPFSGDMESGHMRPFSGELLSGSIVLGTGESLYVAPNGKTYVISYVKGKGYTSTNFVSKGKYFKNLTSIKYYIKKNNLKK